MTITRTILRSIIMALVAMAVISATALAAAPQGSSYIVILKARKGPVPDLAKLGGTVTFRQDDQVVVTIPTEGVAALRGDPLVRDVQALDGSPLIGEPEEPSPGAPKKLVPHTQAGSINWSRQYTYDDAGNIININNANDSSTSQEFVYDALGRLHEMATAGATTESYVYDRYGNQTSRTTSTGTQTMSADAATNRLVLSTGYDYDAAGNVKTGDGYMFSYDALGQAATKSYTGQSTTFSETYIYTAGDERIGVQTSVSDGSSGNWWYWSVRDEGGKVLRQFRSSASDVTQPALWIEDYVYRDGQLVGAERPATLGGRRHYHLDHLGTPRLITSDAGQLVSIHDYLPFGGETSSVWQETGAGFDREDPMKFTGHERDYAGSFGREDGHAIDYMHARYYSGGMGRFLSVDPIEGNPRNPQSLNRYAYVRNNPANLVDPFGLADKLPTPTNPIECGSRANPCNIDVPGVDPNKPKPKLPRPRPTTWYEDNVTEFARRMAQKLLKSTNSGLPRLTHNRSPDYVTLTFATTSQYFVGGGVSVTMDAYGGLYLSPGITVGTVGKGTSLTAAWLERNTAPNAATSDDFVSGLSVSGSAVFGFAYAKTFGGPGNGFADEVGWGVPGAGVYGSWAFGPYETGHGWR
ncbi:MAG: hypothetical protein QOK37_3901 [Thermoanaerobaculia bacterium]|jgi:RHS repeat-associated protein|nr:hypothetical protein [Thermoanaerobaculia bacterium]